MAKLRDHFYVTSTVKVPEVCVVGCPSTALCHRSLLLSVTSITPMPLPLVYGLSANIASVSLLTRPDRMRASHGERLWHTSRELVRSLWARMLDNALP